jgi:hypothetical protein
MDQITARITLRPLRSPLWAEGALTHAFLYRQGRKAKPLLSLLLDVTLAAVAVNVFFIFSRGLDGKSRKVRLA